MEKMAKKGNYAVIGGQYRYTNYGVYTTLIGAKRVANKNQEYWDNWQGWTTPKIYHIDDTRKVTDYNGNTVIIPDVNAMPID